MTGLVCQFADFKAWHLQECYAHYWKRYVVHLKIITPTENWISLGIGVTTHLSYSVVPPIALRHLTTHQGLDEGLQRKGWMLPQVPCWQGVSKVADSLFQCNSEIFVKYSSHRKKPTITRLYLNNKYIFCTGEVIFLFTHFHLFLEHVRIYSWPSKGIFSPLFPKKTKAQNWKLHFLFDFYIYTKYEEVLSRFLRQGN